MTAFPPCPGTASACAASVIGIEGHLTYAGATACDGPPGLRITGLPDTVVRETRDRVYAAVPNSGQPWPAQKITVTLQPASLPRHGTGFDLAIAIAVLTAAGAVPAAALDGCVFTAELGLDGSLRPVRGVLPALLAARRAGYTRAVVATGNAAEAVMVAGLAVVPCADLRTVLAWLRGESFPHQPGISAAGTPAAPGVPPGASLASLAVPPCVRQAIEATAAGGHHLCLTGPHGARHPGPGRRRRRADAPARTGADDGGDRDPLRGRAARPRPRADHPPAVPRPAPHRDPGRDPRRRHRDHPPRRGRAGPLRRACSCTTPPNSPATSWRRCASPCSTARSRSPGLAVTVRFPAKFTLIASTAPCPCGGRTGLLVQRAAGPPLPRPAGRRTRQPHRDLPRCRPARSRHDRRRARSR